MSASWGFPCLWLLMACAGAGATSSEASPQDEVAPPQVREEAAAGAVSGAAVLAAEGGQLGELLALRRVRDHFRKSLRGPTGSARLLTLPDQYVTLSDLAGGYFTVVHFLTHPCAPCDEEWPKVLAARPALSELGLRYLFVGSTLPDKREKLVAHYQQSDTADPKSSILLDADPSMLRLYSLPGIAPATYLLGPDLSILRRWEGAHPELWSKPCESFIEGAMGIEGECPTPTKAPAAQQGRPSKSPEAPHATGASTAPGK